MTWFTEWWNALSLLQQIFAVFAIPATLILILQTVLLLFGLGGHDSEMDNGEADFSGADADGDGIPDALQEVGHFQVQDAHDVNSHPHDGAHSGTGLRLFTLRGIVALFSVGGWLGVAMCDLGVDPVLGSLIALAGGFAALVLCALVIKWSLRMQENGAYSVRNAIAHTATVYIPIPPSRTGTGKITMTLQERFVELEAMTDEPEKLPTGTQVQVVSVTEKNILIVRPTLR